jgi:drug/metabolite transporter (DMT)-like permease
MKSSMKLGLILMVLLSIGDIATLPLSDGHHPPLAVSIFSAILGVASLPLIAKVWRGERRSLLPLIALRVISALTAVPAFIVGGVPTAALVGASAVVVVTAVAVVLVAPRASVEVAR